MVGVHGNDGRLRVQTETDNPARFRVGASLEVAGVTYTVVRTSKTPLGLLLKLKGLDAREEAATLIHEPIVVAAASIPAPAADTYYHYQLIDMAVVNEEGTELGIISEIISTGANDVFVVTSIHSELLVPALGDVVLAVDVAGGRMTVAVPEGIEPRPLKSKDEPKRPPRRRGRPWKKPRQTS